MVRHGGSAPGHKGDEEIKPVRKKKLVHAESTVVEKGEDDESFSLDSDDINKSMNSDEIEETRTSIRTEIDNSNQMLKPDMLITVTVQSKKISKLAVPSSAVVRENDRSYVFAQIGPNKFRLREIEIGSRDGNMVSVLSGITIGETIVVDGAFHLNNERKKKELE